MSGQERLPRWAKRIVVGLSVTAAIVVGVASVMDGAGKLKSAYASLVAPAEVKRLVIPDYWTGDTHGGGADKYCKPKLMAYQAQYPDYTVSMTTTEKHRVERNPFKVDYYNYGCFFSAAHNP